MNISTYVKFLSFLLNNFQIHLINFTADHNVTVLGLANPGLDNGVTSFSPSATSAAAGGELLELYPKQEELLELYPKQEELLELYPKREELLELSPKREELLELYLKTRNAILLTR